MASFGHERVKTLTQPDALHRKLRDFLVLLFGLAACVALARNVSAPSARTVWTIVLFFYFLFYRRVAYVVYWARDTYRRLGATIPPPRSEDARPREPIDEASTPRFHILVAAYNASDSIGPVIRALAAQDYPSDRYEAWIITTNREIRETRSTRGALIEQLGSGSDQRGDAEEAQTALLWWSESVRVPDLTAWIHATSAGTLRSALKKRGAASLVMRDLLGRLLRTRDWPQLIRAGALDPLCTSADELETIQEELATIEGRARSVSGDFERLLGSPDIYSSREIAEELLDASVRARRIRRIGERIAHRFGLSSSEHAPQSATRLARTADRLMRTTQDRVREVIRQVGASNIHHYDSPAEGFKPGALNAAYRHIQDQGFLDEVAETFFIVIDADSLLPRHALRAVADEAGRAKHSGIMQMASIPTANFFGCGWYSRFVSFTDAVGAVGKWARSTRRQLRPDMAAGSGVVVAASLAAYIAEHTGAPWSETTLTEDARLIVGQFGLTHGARSKTRMVPVYLLEAVPASRTFARTYRSYWNQRRRWTIGGFDEFFYMLRAPRWVKYAGFDRSQKRWVERRPTVIERCTTSIRQYYRALLWAWDHLWWGIGSAVILTHWSLVSAFIAEPGYPVFLLGLSAFLLLPLVFLLLVGPPLTRFIPGGFPMRVKITLYFLAFPTIWLYVLPILWTQMACTIGFRSRKLDWRPTQKPRYDALVPFPSEGTLDGGAASTLHLEVS